MPPRSPALLTVHHKNGQSAAAAARLNELVSSSPTHQLTLLFLIVTMTSADVAVSDSNIYTHLTLTVASRSVKVLMAVKHATKSNRDVTASECGGGGSSTKV